VLTRGTPFLHSCAAGGKGQTTVLDSTRTCIALPSCSGLYSHLHCPTIAMMTRSELYQCCTCTSTAPFSLQFCGSTAMLQQKRLCC
jgi:uncharacterized protein YvpB